MNFAVFASGQGGNLQAIINAVKKKKIRATINIEATPLSRIRPSAMDSLAFWTAFIRDCFLSAAPDETYSWMIS